MTPKEESELRSVYAGWPLARLARAATVEKNDYRPEAVLLMEQELKTRAVSPHDVAQLAAAPIFSRTNLRKDTFFFPAELNRGQYLVRWLLWLIAVVGLSFVLDLVPPLENYAIACAIAVGVVYRVIGMDIPRIRSIGWSPWLLVLLAIPIVNLGLVVILFFAPPEPA